MVDVAAGEADEGVAGRSSGRSRGREIVRVIGIIVRVCVCICGGGGERAVAAGAVAWLGVGCWVGGLRGSSGGVVVIVGGGSGGDRGCDGGRGLDDSLGFGVGGRGLHDVELDAALLARAQDVHALRHLAAQHLGHARADRVLDLVFSDHPSDAFSQAFDL